MNTLKIILNAPAFLLGMLLSIPIFGRITGLIWRGILDLFWRIISIPDVILGFFGVLPEKKMRVSVIILANEAKEPFAKIDNIKDAVDNTIKSYKNAANVRVIIDKIHTMETAAPIVNLKPSCSSRAAVDDIWTSGTYFEHTANTKCFDTVFQRIIGYAAPVIVYVVEEVKGADIGCSLGPFTDYVTIEGGKPKCMAHEVAHACGLWHVKKDNNLANHFCSEDNLLDPWQIAIVRSSRHVTYL
jgi:hypothetical protein